MVVEPQESQGQAPQQEVREEAAPGQPTLVASSRLKESLGACPIILNYDIYIRFYYLCIMFQELIGTLVA